MRTEIENAILSAIDIAKHKGFFLEDITTGRKMGNYAFYASEDGLLEIDAGGSNWDEIPLGEYKDDYNAFSGGRESSTVTTGDISQYAHARGYSGVKITNVYDLGARASYGSKDDIDKSTIYSFFNPKKQVKSADPITYDDDGNVIPLSKRFTNKSKDIRY